MNIIGYPKLNNVRKRSQDGIHMTKEYTTLWLEMFANAEFDWILSEKIDGTNLRIIFDEYGGVHFRGRTDKAELHKDLLAHLRETFAEKDENGEFYNSAVSIHEHKFDYKDGELTVNLERAVPHLKAKEKFSDLKSCILFGEGFGAGIQKGGGNYSPTKSFILFDIWRDNGSDRGQWYEWHTVRDIAGDIEIPMVQSYSDYCTAITLHQIEDWVATGMDSHFGNFTAEGVVVRPKWNLFDSRGSRIMLKVKVCDYAG